MKPAPPVTRIFEGWQDKADPALQLATAKA
jgi:hypothetical protein